MTRTRTDPAKLAAGAKAYRDEKAAIQAKTRIEVGEWAVYRLDEYNVVLEPNGDENRREYYPDFEWALKVLLRKHLEPHIDGTIRGILTAIQKAEEDIIEAFRGRRK